MQAELERLKTEAFQTRIAEALARIQPTSDDGDTEPTPPRCETCEDLGMVRYTLPVGHPDFGRMFPCPNPHCVVANERHRQQWERRIASSRIPTTYQQFTFDTWEHVCPQRQRKGKRLAWAACQLFVERPDHTFALSEAYALAGEPFPARDDAVLNSIMLTGPMGVGKTGLVIAAANVLMERGESVLYIRARDIIWEIQTRYKSPEGEPAKKGSAFDMLRLFCEAPILLVDEFNVTKISEDRWELVETLMRYRYTNRLPTLMTANADQDKFSELWGDTAAEAAIAMAHWIEVSGAKLRQTPATAREG